MGILTKPVRSIKATILLVGFKAPYGVVYTWMRITADILWSLISDDASKMDYIVVKENPIKCYTIQCNNLV